MNNSKFAIESVSLQLEEETSNVDSLKEREQKLIRTIEALEDVQNTKSWSSLKQEVFDTLPADLNKQIGAEAKKLNPDIQKLNRLSGELKWAERFSDLSKYGNELRVELRNIRQTLYGKTETNS